MFDLHFSSYTKRFVAKILIILAMTNAAWIVNFKNLKTVIQLFAVGL